MRILLAEDDLFTRMDLAESLSSAGHEVVEAMNGDQAQKILEYPGKIGMVITDLNMPGSNGITVATKARQHFPDVAVLFITSRADLLISKQAPRPYSYLQKPFAPAQFLAAVKLALAKQDRDTQH
ncbi:response regulator [Roseomonas haemaphysalidis]|jgi:response regulator NasT|uniref:Response regulator n=1 Tax=Roseomonas haemaphysalidis TaxID=2768162 RepID=A0ABS3KKZ5_9PROT|nr:response regulator [Roseomonas haemaphysalidis]MBO1078116.1 response regulator [Roseomonas haemaphysalidis]